MVRDADFRAAETQPSTAGVRGVPERHPEVQEVAFVLGWFPSAVGNCERVAAASNEVCVNGVNNLPVGTQLSEIDP